MNWSVKLKIQTVALSVALADLKLLSAGLAAQLGQRQVVGGRLVAFSKSKSQVKIEFSGFSHKFLWF